MELGLNEQKNSKASAFTVIELMVVTAIMVIMASLILANVNGQRAARNLKIAQSQLVTDVRKVQSYSLSSRNLNNTAIQYYILKIDLAKPRQYSIQGIYNSSSAPKLSNIETIYLPQGIRFAASGPVTINGNNITQTCAVLAFATPFGKAIVNDGCSPVNPTFPYTIVGSDDYNKIVTYVVNNSGSTASSDSILVLKLIDDGATQSPKTVTINGITGLITFQ